MAREEAIWHVLIDDERRGPLTKDQILAYLRDGILAGSDLIWRPGFTNWELVSRIADFWEPPAPASRQEVLQAALAEHGDEDNKIEITAPIKKWSIWKSANIGLLISALLFAIALFDTRGFEHASYVQTASAATIASLLSELLTVPLIFVLIAVTRNIFNRRQPKSSASAARGALTFVLLLGAIGLALKLHAYLIFSSTDPVSGAARKKLVEDIQKSCIQKQRSLGQTLTDLQITKYCACTGEKIADGTSYKELGVELDAKARDYLMQRAEAAGRACPI